MSESDQNEPGPVETNQKQPRKNPGGRPSKLTKRVAEKIAALVKGGNYYEVACVVAGVSYGTFRRWMKDGAKEDAEPRYRKFYKLMKEAEAECEARLVLKWQKLLDEPKDHRAIADFLERRHRDRWGRRDAHEISGPAGGPVTLTTILAAADGSDPPPTQRTGKVFDVDAEVDKVAQQQKQQ